MFEVNVNGRKQRYRSKPTMNVDTSGSSASIPKPLTYDYMPEGYPKKDGWSIEWDGNTEGKLYIPIEENFGIYKISDMVPTDDDLLGATFEFLDYPGNTVMIAANNIEAMSDDLVYVYITSPYSVDCYIARKDNTYASDNDIILTEKGVYVFSDSNKFKMTKQNITTMSTDFLPKNLNVVFRGELGHAPTSCNVTYNELRDWVERDIPVFAVFITAIAKFNITGTSLLTDSLGFVYYNDAGKSIFFKYNSDGTFSGGAPS